MIKKAGNVNYKGFDQSEKAAIDGQRLVYGDSLSTLISSWALVRFDVGADLRMAEVTRLEIQQPSLSDPIFAIAQRSQPSPGATVPVLLLVQGELYFLNRTSKVNEVPIRAPRHLIRPKGTEFLISVDPKSQRTEITMFDGEAELTSLTTNVVVRTGQQAIALPGGEVRIRPILEATNLVQWWIYYPGVIDPAELGLAPDEETRLADSLRAYRDGDVSNALQRYPGYPTPPDPVSQAERIYLAAVLLAVGAVDRSEKHLSQVKSNAPLARALRTMIAAVSRDFTGNDPVADKLDNSTYSTSSELLALSYQHQAAHNLPQALRDARLAVMKSTNFSFGWARVAELEFSFGRTRAAREAVQRALDLAPRNAQARALNGFLLAAENRNREAMKSFDEAIKIDPALGNAWLGRGLCKRRMAVEWFSIGGNEPSAAPTQNSQLATADNWLSDLQTAAILEPNRSLLRSYAGKAFADAGLTTNAIKELAYARQLDTNDPTPYLYSALLHREQNEINPAIRDLEESIERNDNRAVYRSRLLLDQDRAVRGVNLASIYRDAGMTDVSAREAARAVSYDYANYSAHLFLANSYFELLNYNPQVNLRYETPRVSEYLVATLLAPVDAGVLSPTVSQQEYSRLFERERLGLASSTEYLSRGAWAESAAQYGVFRNFAYSLDAYYQWDPGQRRNNDLELTSLSARLKQQLTPDDSVSLQVIHSDARFGDLAQYYDPTNPTNGANPLVRSKETQEPILLAGYHHEWSPNSHTLLLAGRLQDTLRVDNPLQGTLFHNPSNKFVIPFTTGQDYRSDLEVYTAEAQQIFQQERHGLIVGGRYQAGRIDTKNTNALFTNTVVFRGPGGARYYFTTNDFDNRLQSFETDLERITTYAYAYWDIVEPLRLISGVAYDCLTYPRNLRYAPISDDEKVIDQLSPKGGMIFSPFKSTVLRAAYNQSLGGVSIDQSFQLQPSQVAGFNQSWRSIIPESVRGANAAERFESWGMSLEQRFPTQTYLALAGESLKSQVDRTIGAFQGEAAAPSGRPYIRQSGTREELDFEERTLTVMLNQPAGEEWGFGARYRLSFAVLEDEFPDIASSAVILGGFRRQQQLEARLQQLNLFTVYNHASGFFAQFDSIWSVQSNHGYQPGLSGDDFWQLNLFVGYHFPRRRAEVQIGLLNLTDQDYHVNPLNLTAELPRERTLAVSFRLSL